MTDHQRLVLKQIVYMGGRDAPEWDVLCVLYWETDKAKPAFRRTIRIMEKDGLITISTADDGSLLLHSTIKGRQAVGYPPLTECDVCLLRRLAAGETPSTDPHTQFKYLNLASNGLMKGSFRDFYSTDTRITDYGREALAIATSQPQHSAAMPEGK